MWGESDLYELEEHHQVGVNLQLPPVLCYHVHDLLHHLGMAAGVDGEPGGRGQVRVLLQGHCLVQVVLKGKGVWPWLAIRCSQHNQRPHLADILVHLLLREWLLLLVIAEQPEARSAVEVVISDVEVVCPSPQDAVLLLPGKGHGCSLLGEGTLGGGGMQG